MKIVLKGLPRSGTNLLEYTLQQNYDVEVKSGSKHGIVGETNAPVIYIVKHPVSWINSFYAYSKDRPGAIWLDAFDDTIEHFIESPIIMATGPKGMWFRTPMDVWNCMYTHYHNMGGYQMSIERLNTISLSLLADTIGLKQTSEKLTITSSSMNTNATPTSQKFEKRKLSFDKSYAELIMDHMRPQLTSYYGYKLEDVI